MKNEPFIRVMNKAELSSSGTADLTHVYDMDQGPLAMPAHIHVGATSVMTDQQKPFELKSYTDMVSEYDMWLADQVQAASPGIITAIDDIYNLALGQGVILATIAQAQPWSTHAHMVMNLITRLAADQADQEDQQEEENDSG